MKSQIMDSSDQQEIQFSQLGDIDSLLWRSHSNGKINEIENERTIHIEFLIQMNNIYSTNNVLVSGTTNISPKLMSAIHQQTKTQEYMTGNLYLVSYKYHCNALYSLANYHQLNKLSISSQDCIDIKTSNVSVSIKNDEEPVKPSLLQTVLCLLQICEEKNENKELEEAIKLYIICFKLYFEINERKILNTSKTQ